MVASQGLEPQQAESESAVLPLHHEATARTFSNWRGRRGSNPQPPDRQSSALTNCATTPRPESGAYYTINSGSGARGYFEKFFDFWIRRFFECIWAFGALINCASAAL